MENPMSERIVYPLRVQIHRSTTSGLAFPYAGTPKDKQFVQDNVGGKFKARCEHPNIYELENGHQVHVYDAIQIADLSQDLICKHCFRDYSGDADDPDIMVGGACPEEECPGNE